VGIDAMEKAVFEFKLEGNPVYCERYGCGHINLTYLVETDKKKRYILQKINTHVFPDVEGLMKNITLVTRFISTKVSSSREAMSLVETKGGKSFYRDEEGGCWRVYDFIENGLCLQTPEGEQDFYESAIAFGNFMQRMSTFHAYELNETIKDFHNTIDRYRIFKETLKKDPMGRVKELQKEIEFVLSREEEAGRLQRMRESSELPLRVTHNDTKLNNVMLDNTTRKALCVIDLDTVMPGLSLYDFGDSIRFGAATAPEDEKDLSKMSIDLELFRTYVKGFVKACPSLTYKERQLLPLGAKTMTLECGIRFLTDYIDGDHYFAVHRDKHNLDRARTQFKLVEDMEARWKDMNQIIKEETLI
jgi:aminoglycoside phosphotransferase (APT) family kinase protein